jgi:hypothetical protein
MAAVKKGVESPFMERGHAETDLHVQTFSSGQEENPEAGL